MLMNKESNDDDGISGGVDKSEIEAALNQSKPTLPTLPVNSVIPNLQTTQQFPEMPILPKPPVRKCLDHLRFLQKEFLRDGQWSNGYIMEHQWLKENKK